MPGFFDFTNPFAEINPEANSPMLDDVEQAGNYDFMANVPQSMPPRPPSGAPYNALAAMSGIEMPQMPQQDSMGRYGITDDQSGDAGRQSLASILRGVSGTLFNDRPDDVLRAAAGSGDIRRGALDKASLENVNAFKLQVEAKAKELDFISKKSEIQKQEMQMEAEAMKLEDLKLKRQVAIQWGKEMAPVMSQTLQKTAAAYGLAKANDIKSGFIGAQTKLALGDVEGAQEVYKRTIMELPGEWAKKAHEDMIKATLVASNKFQVGDALAKSPAFLQMVAESEGRIERGDDGMPHVVTKSEIEVENLKRQVLQEQIASERARQASYTNPGGGMKGARTQAQIDSILEKANTGAREALRILEGQGGLKLEKNKDADQKALSAAMGDLAVVGLADAAPEQIRKFLSLNSDPMSQAQYIRGGIRGFAAVPASGGGAPAPNPGMPGTNPGQLSESVAVARKGMVDVARKTPGEKWEAIQTLLNSGDKEAQRVMVGAKNDPRYVNNPKFFNDPNELFNYLAGKLKL